MNLRTDSLLSGTSGSSGATIVKAAVKAAAAACAGLLGGRGLRHADALTLSEYELCDIALGQASPGAPIAYDLLDLVPRGGNISHRAPR